MNPFEGIMLNKLYPFTQGLVERDILVVVPHKATFNDVKVEMTVEAILGEFGLDHRVKILVTDALEAEKTQDFRYVWLVGDPELIGMIPTHVRIVRSDDLDFMDMAKNFDEEYARLEKFIPTKFPETARPEVELCSTSSELDALVTACTSRPFAWDTETHNLHNLTMLMASFTYKSGGEYINKVVPVYHDDSPLPAKQSLEAIREILWGNQMRSGHNITFDAHVIKKNLGSLPPYYRDGKLVQIDTMLAVYMVYNKLMSLKLKDISKALYNSGDYEEALHKELKKKFKRMADWSFDVIPLNILYPYAGLDSYYTYKIAEDFSPLLNTVHGGIMAPLYKKHIMPVSHAVTKMEANTFKIDRGWTETYLNALETYQQKIEDDMKAENVVKCNFEDFKIRSTDDLQHLFFDVLKSKVRNKTKTGLSTDVSTMEEISLMESEEDSGRFASQIIIHRRAGKIKGYLKAFLAHTLKGDMVKPSFLVHGTANGRLSSSGDFNAQNLPSRRKVGVKRCIESRFGKEGCIVNVDYKTLEFRIAAALSKDPKLAKLLADPNVDLHTATACMVFEKKEEDVTPEERFVAKTTNFSIIYGAGAKKVAEITGLDKEFVKPMVEKYRETYKGLMDAMDRGKAFAVKHGYVKSHWGRVRPFPELLNTRLQSWKKFKHEREAYNMIVQSFSVDICLRALMLLTREMEKKGLESKLILQVHDSLVFDVKLDEMDTVMEMIVRIMERESVPDLIKIPVPVEFSVGPTYEDQVEITEINMDEIQTILQEQREKSFKEFLEIEEYVEKVVTPSFDETN
jgi:DNA polymerase I